MNAMTQVFSHRGNQTAALRFAKGLGFVGVVQASSAAKTEEKSVNKIVSSEGTSSSGDYELPLIGDVGSIINTIGAGIDLFGKWNIAKSGGKVVTEPGGSGTPGMTPGERSANLFGAKVPSSAIPLGIIAVIGIAAIFIMKK